MKTKFEQKKFAIAATTGAVPLKDILKEHFERKGYEVLDVGATVGEPMNYYDAGANAARAVKDGVCEFAIVCCGSGMGVCMTANRFPGIHCAVCESIHTVKLARRVNNVNVLALGSFILAPQLAILMAEAFIDTEFLEGYDEAESATVAKNFEMLGEVEKRAIEQYAK